MDIKVIFWIAVTIVILLIIIAFWSEKDMFFKKNAQKENKENKCETEAKHRIVNSRNLLINGIDLIIEFLNDFSKEDSLIKDGNINRNICELLDVFTLRILEETKIDVCMFNKELNQSGLYDDLFDLKYLFNVTFSFSGGYRTPNKNQVFIKLKRIRTNLLNDNKFFNK